MIAGLSETILDSLTSGVLAVDVEDRIVFMNVPLCQYFGIDRKDWIGKAAAEFFSSLGSQVSAKRRPLYRREALREDLRTRSREVEWNDGSRVVHLREDSGPLRDVSGTVTGRLYSYHDLSWEKTIDQMKSEFISIASHELRTPMTSIKGSVDLILGGCTGEINKEALELLEVAHGACDRMIRLINDILDLSKIEARQIKLKLAPIQLGDAVDYSLRSLKSIAEQDGISFKVESSQDLPFVEADRDRIEQVVTNLVFNAIKFSPAKGEITVSLWADDGWVSCSVADQGHGIKEEDLDRIFGKFQQLGSPQRGGGTGLGLAITHALITEHRGKIWVESRVGEGSRFVFRLPKADRGPHEKAGSLAN
jgi:PAS domain S-box-containing protein